MLGDTLNSHKLLSATICLICLNLELIEGIVVEISQLQKAPIWCKIALDRTPVWTALPSPALAHNVSRPGHEHEAGKSNVYHTWMI